MQAISSSWPALAPPRRPGHAARVSDQVFRSAPERTFHSASGFTYGDGARGRGARKGKSHEYFALEPAVLTRLRLIVVAGEQHACLGSAAPFARNPRWPPPCAGIGDCAA